MTSTSKTTSMRQHNYYFYINTNPGKTVLYSGMTNDIEYRLIQHYENRGKPDTFAGRYYCYCLVYFEYFRNINDAIRREKQVKGWIRRKKEELINSMNPDWRCLNDRFMDWPPK